MRVYMFHSHEFRAPVMSPFFWPHEPFEDITSDDIRPPFHPPRYLIDGEFDFDTQLTPTVSLDFNPSESSYSTYSVRSYCSEPSQLSVIHLSSYSSTSSAGPIPAPVHGHGFIHTRVVPRGRGRARGEGHENDAASGFRNGYLRSMVDLDCTCWADHEDSFFFGYGVIIFLHGTRW